MKTREENLAIVNERLKLMKPKEELEKIVNQRLAEIRAKEISSTAIAETWKKNLKEIKEEI